MLTTDVLIDNPERARALLLDLDGRIRAANKARTKGVDPLIHFTLRQRAALVALAIRFDGDRRAP